MRMFLLLHHDHHHTYAVLAPPPPPHKQIAFDKSAGTKKKFFGGYVEVKETKDFVDKDAYNFGNRFKEAFGLRK